MAKTKSETKIFKNPDQSMWSSIKSERDEYGVYRSGYVVTGHGVVLVTSSDPFKSKKLKPYATLAMVHDGELVRRSIDASYTKRGLSTVARRFAAEIAG